MKAVKLMDGFDHFWCISGLWGLDLFSGRLNRPDSEVEIILLRQNQSEFKAQLSNWSFKKILESGESDFWDGEWLDYPISEIQARNLDVEPYSIQVLLNESEEDQLVFPDAPALSLHLSSALQKNAQGMPFLNPEIILLFQAIEPENVQSEFNSLIGRFTDSQKNWLKNGLSIYFPDHQWLSKL